MAKMECESIIDYVFHGDQISYLNRFQWVVCQLDMLQRCLSVAAVRKTLKDGLPKSLDETYDHILSGIDETHHLEVIKTLKALTATAEALSFEELVDILAVDLDSSPPGFNPDARLLEPRSILSICSSLVTTTLLRKDVEFYLKTETVTVLRLAHASVADYLTRSTSTALSKFHFSNASARQFIAQTCLAYLLCPKFANILDPEELEKRFTSYPFLQHAAAYWPLYLNRQHGDPEDYLEPRTRELLHAFFATSKLPNGGNFSFWVSTLIPDSPHSHVRNTQPLYYAASFGLTEVVQIILDTETDIEIDALGGRAFSSPLHVATYRGHVQVVKMLLERGADPNLPNINQESPIYWAAVIGNKEIQKLLLEYGAENLRSKPRGLQENMDERLMASSFNSLDEVIEN
jgi:hypothetical protein